MTTFIILFSMFFPMVELNIYLTHTQDGPSIEFYDCLLIGSMTFCRRPDRPIDLNRTSISCEIHGGKTHFFQDLISEHQNSSEILHKWKSSLEQVEEFLRFQNNKSQLKSQFVCQCHQERSFGKFCEYELPMGNNFKETLDEQTKLRNENPWQIQIYGNITCYTGIHCNASRLCLDWREICDKVSNCVDGIDEEQCDLLEINICNDDEYRCANGMCIPVEYFLDGKLDCLDWSDEMSIKSSEECASEAASEICDDHVCLANQWSCGDGQCIRDRFAFQQRSEKKSCINRRDQFFLCETHAKTLQWTMPNGRCFGEKRFQSIVLTNRTEEEKCEFLLKCALSEGSDQNCPCRLETAQCSEILAKNCSLSAIQYPRGAFPTPNSFFLFNNPRKSTSFIPDFLRFNGTINCQGRSIPVESMISYRQFSESNYVPENFFCSRNENLNTCFRSNESTNVCQQWNPCFSVTRINDGAADCLNKQDEKNRTLVEIEKSCARVRHHRFRCSIEQPTCLSVMALGNDYSDCQNRYDELMIGTTRRLSQLYCNLRSDKECSSLRQYVAQSWSSSDRNQEISVDQRIPFRSYCDTMIDFGSAEDEDLLKCQQSWICETDQWQCRNGQCINHTWILDGEWDCFDGSDEERWFINITSSIRQQFDVPENCRAENVSFICLDPRTKDRQIRCLNFSQVGDTIIDCLGAVDEQNSRLNINESSTQLGHNFLCSSNNMTIPFYRHCTMEGRCLNRSDDELWCRWFDASASNCATSDDFMRFNDRCIEDARCNRTFEYPFGEDEYMCDYVSEEKQRVVDYREAKQKLIEMMPHAIHLPIFPYTSMINMTSNFHHKTLRSSVTQEKFVSAFSCNRGVGILSTNHSIVCFCPPQYYGEFCQYHADRLIVRLHLNLSQSNYTTESDKAIVIKLLVVILFNDQVLMTHDFNVRAATEIYTYTKKMVHFPYSRSSFFRQHRIERRLNRSNIIDVQPYSILIEAYERNDDTDIPLLIGAWKYPLVFDYLPVYRFSKALHLPKNSPLPNPCSSRPCPSNADCFQLFNHPTQYICLCKTNFTGENCSIEDQQCAEGYCASSALCKPNYRRVLRGNSTPFCICPFNRFGERCDIVHDSCTKNPCRNNGTCFPTGQADLRGCVCTEDFYGRNCEFRKVHVHLSIIDQVRYSGVVVQYFNLDFIVLELNLVHQQVYSRLPSVIDYHHDEKLAPPIIIAKVYRTFNQFPADLYLLSVNINTTLIEGFTQLSDFNRCQNLQTFSNSSPIEYHQICRRNRHLFCFHVDVYLCICAKNHSRVECFRYNDQLDRCSSCLFNGRCLRGTNRDEKSFVCLCPPCHFGHRCQFNSKASLFSLDQLLYKDLTSQNKKRTGSLFIFASILSFIVAIPNNLFAFITFRRRECLRSGIGHYLLCLSVINQITIGFFAARLLHIVLSMSGSSTNILINDILCKVVSYSFTCFLRISGWLASFIALERVYTALFFTKQWFKQPHIARRLMTLMIFLVFLSGFYELFFTKTFSGIGNGKGMMCVFAFPEANQTFWLLFHQIVSIIHFYIPFFINIGCTGTIISIVIRSKMDLHRHKTSDENSNYPRRNVLRNVLNENKEMISRPFITLIPSSFCLFSIPLLTTAFTLKCDNVTESPLRHLIIICSSLTMIPSIITFFVYIYPSTFYWKQWQNTNIGQRVIFRRNLHSNKDMTMFKITSNS